MTETTIPRRAMIKRLGAIGAAAAALPPTEARAREELDRFGGLQAVRFEPSGFFRVAKKDRWWFVTPDGTAFLSFGLNHANQEYLLQKYNIDHWLREFGVTSKDDPAFGRGFARRVMRDLEAFGMNSLGTHARKEAFGQLSVPYVQGLYFVRTPYWTAPTANRFVDVFSSDFEDQCERVAARLVAPRSEDPYLLGYTLTDCPVLTDEDARARGQVPWGRAQIVNCPLGLGS